MDTFDNIGYLAAQCDMREAEATTEHERNHWHARAEQLRRTQESFGASPDPLTARSIIAEMEQVGRERIEDYRNLAEWSDYPHANVLDPGPRNHSKKPIRWSLEIKSWGGAIAIMTLIMWAWFAWMEAH